MNLTNISIRSFPFLTIALSSVVVASGIEKDQLAIPTFSDPSDLVTISGGSALAFADLDGDRDEDMVVGCADGTVKFYENQGNILNAEYVEIAQTSLDAIDVGARAVPAIADLDKDGDQDLIIGAADGSLVYFKNTGSAFSAVFSQQTGANNPFSSYGVGANASPTVGDVDYNGTLDVLIGAADGTVKYLSNTGTVVTPVFTELTGANSFLTGVDFGVDAVPSLGDIDADTDVDLVVSNQAGTFTLYHNGRGGYQGDSLTAIELPEVPSIGRYETGVNLVDTGWSLVHAEVNPFTSLTVSGAGVFVDLDADGDRDFVTIDAAGGVGVLDSNSIKKLVGVQGTHGVDGNPYTVDKGPYSGLGYDPRVKLSNIIDSGYESTTRGEDLYTEELLRESLGSIAEMWMHSWTPPGDSGSFRTFWYTRAAGDLNGDGILDIVTLESSIKSQSDQWKTSISWKTADEWNLWGLENTAVSGWVEDYHSDIPEFLHGNVELADLDRDGDLDLIVGGQAVTDPETQEVVYNHLGYYENTGDAANPTFVRRKGEANLVRGITFDSVRTSATPKFADLDGDGDLDCALGLNYGQVAYWENTSNEGAVSFTKRADMVPNTNPGRHYPQPMFADFDKDGDLDLVVLEMSRAHDINLYETVNWSVGLGDESRYPSHYRFFENRGTALKANFVESASFTDWNAQEEAGNPLFRVFDRSRHTWPSYWYSTSPDTGLVFRASDGFDRILLADFNYDGYPDVHYMRQEVRSGTGAVWNYFYRTMVDSQAPTASMSISYDAPYFTHENLVLKVSFDEQVDRLKVDDFSVVNLDTNQVVSLSGVTLTGSGKSYTLTIPGSNFADGNFRISLVAANSIAHDSFGNKLENDASLDLPVTELRHDLGVQVASVLTAVDGDALSYTVTLRNDLATDATGAILSLRVSKWLADAQVSNIAATGGASTSRSVGVMGLTVTDSVNLPAQSTLIYTITGTADIDQPLHGRSANVCSVSATIAEGSGFVDQNGFNDHAAFHTQISPKTLPSGVFVDQGKLLGSSTTNFYASSHADLDGDGLLDMMLFDGGTFGYAKNGGAGDFFTTFVGNIGDSQEVGSPHYVVGDLDHDGDLDVVTPDTTIFGFGGVQIFINEGSDSFTPLTIDQYSSDHAYLRDMDNDGDIDIVLDTEVLWNDGAATFTTSTEFTATGITMGVADLNGDGKNDLVRSNGVLLQDERGDFSPQQSIPVPNQTYEEVHIVDMDLDGDLDLVFAGWAEKIYLNDGGANFTESEAFSSNFSSSEEWNNSFYIRSAMGDLNGDGYPDLVKVLKGTLNISSGTYSGTNSDSIFYGNGNGGFEAPISFGELWTYVDMADFNGDGRLDLAVGAPYATGNEFRILLATAPAEVTLLGDSPMTIAAGTDFATVDPGAKASDVTDGNLTSSITVDASALIGQTSGTYDVLYSVEDSEGNVTTVARQVSIDRAPTVAFVHSQFFNVMADTYQLDASASSDPEDGANLTYFWRMRDQSKAVTFDDNTSATPVIGNLLSIGYGAHYVRCYVTDSVGQTTMKEASFFVLKAPIADAGEDILAEENATVVLDASASHDPDDPFNGTGIFYLWRQVSGPAMVSFSDNRSKVTQATGFTQKGVYEFEFLIQDWNDLEATDRVRVIVSGEPTASIASSGVVTHLGAGRLSLDGSASSAEVGTLSYLWEQVDAGPFATITYETTATPSIEGMVEGESYTFQLTVTDEYGASSSDTVVVNLPLAHYMDSGVGEFASAQPTAWGEHDITGESAGFHVVFDFTEEMQNKTGKFYFLYELSSQNVSSSSHSLAINGQTLLVGVTDSTGASRSIQAPMGISAPLEKVNVKVVYENQTDEAVTIYVNGVKVKEEVLDLADAWAVADRSYLGTWHSTHSAVLKYPSEAIHFAAYQLSGTNKPDGNTEASFLAATWKPVADAGADQVVAINSADLDASQSYDVDGTIASYQWEQVSGPASTMDDSTSATPQVSNLVLGASYSFQVIVTDNEGGASSAVVQVDYIVPPNADAGADLVVHEASATLDGSQSSDPVGGNLTYSWAQVDTDVLATIVNGDTATPTISGLITGESYTFRLTVTNASNESASDEVVVSLPKTHFVSSGKGVLTPANPAQWGASSITSESVALNVTFDYTAELAASSRVTALYQVGSGDGPSLYLQGQYLYFLIDNASGGNENVFVEHGLTEATAHVTVTAVLEYGAQDKTSIYVNGVKVGESAFALRRPWASGSVSYLGTTTLAEQSSGVDAFPYESIHMGVYQLSGVDVPDANSVATILAENADRLAPVITLNGNANLIHGVGEVYVDAGATAMDSLEGDLTNSINVIGVVDVHTIGSYTLTYTVVDSAGNAAQSVTRTVTVADIEAPVITLVGATEVHLELNASTYVEQGAVAVDSVDPSVNVSIGGDTVDTSKVGTYIVTYNATDASGNAASEVTRTMHVSDTTAPVISLVGAAEVTHEAGTAYSDQGAAASDSSDGNLSGLVVTTGTVDVSKLGDYTLLYSVSDTAGNSATAVTRTVIVADRIAPVMSLNGAANVLLEVGDSYSDAGATAVDSFEDVLTDSISVSGSVDVNAAGVYTIYYNVSDSSGNAAAALSRVVTVNALPVANAGEDQIDVEESCTLTAVASSDSDGTITNYAWSLVSGSANLTNPSGPTTELTGLEPGESYVLRLTVTDNHGSTSSDELTVQARALTAYEKWSERHLAPVADHHKLAESADASGDGVQNIVAFVTDKKPSERGSYLDLQPEATEVKVSFKRRADAEDYRAVVEYSYDLVTWLTATDGEAGVSVHVHAGGHGVDSTGEALDRVEVSIPKGEKQNVFTRLRVERKVEEER